MSKVVDNNGYWEIKHNPISKVGVFPYLGKSISDECEPDKIYNVYRSAETLAKSVPTWDNPPKPFINDHEMLGEGFSKIDERPVQGVIHNPVFEDDVLYADISVYSESLKDAISNGKKELSLGYFCKYRKEKGVYNGQAYDYVQEDMVGNHIALVDNGRCGSDVKVFDSKCTMDSLDICLDDLKTISESGIIKTTETKDSEMKDEEKKDVEVKDEETEKEVKDNDTEVKEEKKSEDCSKAKDEEEKKDDEKKAEDEDLSAADVMSFLKLILEEIRTLNGKKTTDEEEKKEDDKKTEDEDEEKKSEDEDEEKKSEDEDDEEKKKSEDSAIVMTFAKDSREAPKSFAEDVALRAYLGLN